MANSYSILKKVTRFCDIFWVNL